MAPMAKMSVRASASYPSSCSGTMYCIVLRMVPYAVKGAPVSGRPMRRQPRASMSSSPARIEELRPALGQHDVPRFEIAMDDASPVRGGERAADLDSTTQ